MIVNIGISISFLIVLIILSFVYYSKEKINSMENRVFKKLIPITMVGLCIESIIYYDAIVIHDSSSLTLNIFIKLLYVYYVFWMAFFVLYGYIVF